MHKFREKNANTYIKADINKINLKIALTNRNTRKFLKIDLLIKLPGR